MKTQEQIEKMLAQYELEYKNLTPLFHDKKAWLGGEKFMECDDNVIRATSAEYTELRDRACKFAGAIAVLKIILDEPVNK